MLDQSLFYWLLAGLGTGIALPRLLKALREWHINRMAKYLFKQLSQVYFCSYTLLDVYLLRFFPRYREFVDWGFCGPIAGMSMLALRHNRTARYVYARAGKENYEHCWAEFRYLGVWYVVDVCWQDPFVRPRRQYYKAWKPKILKVCDYETFWSYPISQQFYEKMQKPESSWLLCELMYTYNFEKEETERLFNPEIETINLSEDIGYYLNPYLFYDCPEIIFSRRVMHEMMQRPQRRRPTAHCIRKVLRHQRHVRAAFERYEREHPEEAS